MLRYTTFIYLQAWPRSWTRVHRETTPAKWSERDLNPRRPDFKSGALTTRPGCLHSRLPPLFPRLTSESIVACVAGGISGVRAFVLVSKPWTRVAKPWEDWWRVQLKNSWGFFNYAFTSAREFRIGWEYRNVNQVLIYTSHLSLGKRFVFIHRFAKWTMRRNAKRKLWIPWISAGRAEKLCKWQNRKGPLELISENDVKWGWLAYTTSKFYGSWHM